MSGWRDEDGLTNSERRKRQRAAERAAMLETAKKRPLSAFKAAAAIGFTLLLAGALVLQFVG